MEHLASNRDLPVIVEAQRLATTQKQVMIFGLGENCASRSSHVLEKGYHHDSLVSTG